MKKGILISTLSLMALTIVGCTKSQNQSQENGCNEVTPTITPSNPTVEPDNPVNPTNPTNPTNKVTVEVSMNGGKYDGENYYRFSVRPGTLWRAAKVNIDTSKITYDQYHTFKSFSLKPYEDDTITDSYVVKENFTAYVRYNVVIPPEDQCKVKWLNSDDTELTQSEIYGKGETPVYKGPDPIHPIVHGHTFQFIGWNPKLAPLTGDVTYRAQYFDITAEHTVTFDYQYDGITKGVTVKDGDKVSSFTPERYGYSFTGWYNTSECVTGDLFDFDQGITSDVTIYAGWNQNTRTVTFNHLDKATDPTVTTVTVNYGEKVSSFIPTREHYGFLAWVKEGETEAFNFDTIITENITLNATWDALTYKVSFNMHGASYIEPMSAKYNTTITLPSPSWTGHKFKGWKLGGQEVSSPYLVTGDVTLDATWSQDTCTVTFNWSDGIIPTVTSKTVNYGERVAPETPTYTGHVFKYWETNDIIPEVFSFDDPITEDITLFAVWDIKQFTVTFSCNGGHFPDSDVTMTTRIVDYDDTIPVLSAPDDPVRANYDFAGWYQENGDPFIFSAIDIIGTNVTSDMAVHAAWDHKDSHTVTFLVDGAEYASETIPYGDKAYPPTTDPSKPGCSFLGWFNGNDKFDFNTTITTNYTLNAKFTDPQQFTVTFISNGGSDVPAQTITYGSKVNKPNPDPSFEGHTFAGWYDNPTFTGDAYDFDTSVTKSFNLYAKWSDAQVLTVKFMDDETQIGDDVLVNYGDKVLRPTDPAPKGELPFDNWYTDKTYATPFNFGNPIKTNTNIYAHWAAHADAYTVNFDAKGGTHVDSIAVAYDSTIATSPATERTGYTFNGWWIDDTHEFEFGTGGTHVVANITVYAKWNVKTDCKVQFNPNGGQWSTDPKTDPREVMGNYGELPTIETPTNGTMVFVGWKRQSDNKIGVLPFDVTPQGQTYAEVYTAQWEQGGYTYHTVTFNSEGGSAVIEQHVKEGEKAIKPTDPTKEGSIFKNWYLEGQSATTAFDFDNTTITGPITLHANWEAAKYTVTWYDEDGITVLDSKNDYAYNASLVLPVASKTPTKFEGSNRLKFLRWSPNASTSMKVTGNMNFYAVYGVNNTINFEYDSSSYSIEGSRSFIDIFEYGDFISFTFDSAPPTVYVYVDGTQVSTGYTYVDGVITIDTTSTTIRNATLISLSA